MPSLHGLEVAVDLELRGGRDCLDDLAAWWSLHAAGSGFLSHGWCAAYARHATEATVRVGVFRRGGEVVGAVPLQVDGGVAMPLCYRRTDRVRLVYSAEPPEARRAMLHTVLDAVGATELRVRNLGASDAELVGWPEEAEWIPCPQAAIAGWRERIGRKLRYELRHDERLLEERGARHDVMTSITPGDVRDFVALADGFRARYGRPALAASPGALAFLVDASVALAAQGAAFLSVVRVGDRPISMALVLSGANRVEYFGAGHALDTAPLSVGTVHLAWILDHVEALGAHEHFDFLRGPETYKYRFGAVDGEAVAFGTFRRP